MFDGLIELPWWGVVLVTLVLTHITIASVTIFLHRHQAHHALFLHPVLSHFFRFWLWLTTGMVTREWVAIHRKHHAKCETPEDPHSPQIAGIHKVLLQGTELYRKAARNPETLERYGHGTPDDWLERNLYARHPLAGVTVMFFVDVLLYGPIGITIWAVQMLWIPFWAAGVINGLGHWWGYRNFATPDAATNIIPLGILIGGEEMHNNHHAFASSAKFSAKWWEFDIGWLYIRILAWMHLARIRKVLSRPIINPRKLAIDADALVAIISHRFQVMSRYGHEVLARVYRDELLSADSARRGLLQRARALLLREESLLDEDARRRLQSLLNVSQSLCTVYQYKQQLQAIWKRTTASQEQLLHALQEWCRAAEATGIRALQDFARGLGSYTLQPG